MEIEFVAGCVKGILEKYADPIKAKLTSIAKDEWEKFKIDSDMVFLNYLSKAYEKHSKIKTILYKTEPKYIYDFFEYPTLSLYKQKRISIDSNDVNNCLDISHFLIIQGTGGIGKSTFMKHLFINELSKNDLIPIFIELKDLNDVTGDYDITDFIFSKLYNLGADFDKKYLDYALKSGCFLFLLDGYDEIVTENKNIFLKKITDFCDRYSENYFILSSRPYSEFVEFQRFTVLSLCKFSKKQAISLINKIEYDEAIKNRFVKALDEELYDKHTSFASNPLLLNIMLLTYDNYAEIPEKLHIFYANAFDTLYLKHDANKGGYKRELKSNLSSDYFKKVFSYFCFITYYQGKVVFTRDELISTLKKVKLNNIEFNIENIIFDLVNSICMLCRDGLDFCFVHRSFQEYFTAIFLKELSDSNMKQMSLQLIKKDPYRIACDSTFDMLFDMCEERVEQNVFLPLFLEFEEECTIDKYDFYYEKFYFVFKFDDVNNKGEIGLWLRHECKNNIMFFIRKVTHIYRLKCWKSDLIYQQSQKALLDYLIENKKYEIGNEINGCDYASDPIFYELIRKTWVGDYINTAATLCEKLKEKKKEIDLDLSELLI